MVFWLLVAARINLCGCATLIRAIVYRRFEAILIRYSQLRSVRMVAHWRVAVMTKLYVYGTEDVAHCVPLIHRIRGIEEEERLTAPPLAILTLFDQYHKYSAGNPRLNSSPSIRSQT
jgi:hypothetical protein